MVGLLDTSTLLWALAEPERLSGPARRFIERGDLAVSVASFWEVVVKTRTHQLTIADPVSWWNRAVEGFGAQVLPIRTAHVAALWGLPELHKDPFDRILIAQATAEGLPLVTSDRVIATYPVRVLW